MTEPFLASQPTNLWSLACSSLIDPQTQSRLAWIVHFQAGTFSCPLTILQGLIDGRLLWRDSLPPDGTIVKLAQFLQDSYGLAGADRV